MKKNRKQFVSIALFILMIFVGAQPARVHGAELGVEMDRTIPSAINGGTREGTKGWWFRSSAIEVTSLGIFDPGGDGLDRAHEVGLWEGYFGTTDSTLLSSVTIPSGTEAELQGGYRFVPISPVRLAANSSGPLTGTYYVIGAHYLEGDSDNAIVPFPDFATGFGPGIQAASQGRIAQGLELRYPANVDNIGTPEGSAPWQHWEPNFTYNIVPEPGTSALFAAGAVILLLYKRRLPKSRPAPSSTQ